MYTIFIYILNSLGLSIISNIFSDYRYLRINFHWSVLSATVGATVLLEHLVVGVSSSPDLDLYQVTGISIAMSKLDWVSQQRVRVVTNAKWTTYTLDIPNLLISDLILGSILEVFYNDLTPNTVSLIIRV